MSQYIYWPYDEVKFDVDAAAHSLRVRAPWLQLRTRLQADEDKSYSRLSDRIEAQSLSAEDVPWVHSLVQRFEKFPLSYILGTDKPEATDSHVASGLLESAPTVRRILERSLQNEPLPSDVNEVLQYLARQDFEWDAEAALQFANTKDGVHPESLFSVARRYHLLDSLQNDKGKEVFAHIESLSPSDRARAVAKLVRQNHFVTQRCRESLSPAAEKSQSARKRVEDFMRAESGHDRILGRALEEFTASPDDIPVSTSTVCLMNLLKLAAETNFLAFAMAIDFFERSSYEETDPLAQLLVKAGFEEAARQINRHKEINDVGEHENVACRFLEPMKPCTPEYAVEALRLAESISLVMSSITKASLNNSVSWGN